MPDGRDPSLREWLADVLLRRRDVHLRRIGTAPASRGTRERWGSNADYDAANGDGDAFAAQSGTAAAVRLHGSDHSAGSFGAALRGVVAAAECVEQIRAVGGHQ
jgi:hypothetical protein